MKVKNDKNTSLRPPHPSLCLCIPISLANVWLNDALCYYRDNTWLLGIEMCDQPGGPGSETQILCTTSQKREFWTNLCRGERGGIQANTYPDLYCGVEELSVHILPSTVERCDAREHSPQIFLSGIVEEDSTGILPATAEVRVGF